MKKQANELNRAFSKEDVQMAKNTHEKMLTILAIKEMQIKTTLRFSNSGTQATTNVGEDFGGKKGPSYTAGGNVS
jgi:hypothetical protein